VAAHQLFISKGKLAGLCCSCVYVYLFLLSADIDIDLLIESDLIRYSLIPTLVHSTKRCRFIIKVQTLYKRSFFCSLLSLQIKF